MKIDYKPFELDTLEVSNLIDSIKSARFDTDSSKVVVVGIKFDLDTYKVPGVYKFIHRIITDIFRDNEDCLDIIQQGDLYLGIFDAPQDANIKEVIVTLGKLNAAFIVIQNQLKEYFDVTLIHTVVADFGIVYHSSDSIDGWHGYHADNVIHLCNKLLSKEYNRTVLITDSIKMTLRESFAELFYKIVTVDGRDLHLSDVINSSIRDRFKDYMK